MATLALASPKSARLRVEISLHAIVLKALMPGNIRRHSARHSYASRAGRSGQLAMLKIAEQPTMPSPDD